MMNQGFSLVRFTLVMAIIFAGLHAAGWAWEHHLTAPPPRTPEVTYEQLRQVRQGMSMDEIEALFGRRGEEDPQPTVLALGSEYVPWSYFRWHNEDGTRASVMVRTDTMVAVGPAYDSTLTPRTTERR